MAMLQKNAMAATPAFALMLGDKDITTNVSQRLISLNLVDNRGFVADQLDIELDDSDGLVTLPSRGAVLSLFLGWENAPLVDKGRFVVDEIEHRGAPDTLTIRARSADFRGTLNTRQERSWHDTTLGSIIDAIAARNSLSACVAPALASIAITHIDQSQESDASFLARLAQRNGAEVSIKAGKLLFIQAGKGLSASSKPLAPCFIRRCDGDQHRFTLADRLAYTGVTAGWLQTSTPTLTSAVKLTRVKKAQHLRALQQPKVTPVNKRVSSSINEPREGEYLAGTSDNVFALTTVYASKTQAMRAALAKWDKLQRGVAEFSINLALGRAELCPETPVQVSGFKRVIDEQPWTITSVTHVLNNRGFTTTLALEVKLADVTYAVGETSASQ